MTDPHTMTLVQERLAHNTWGLLGSQGYVLGLDVGGYGLRAALVDLERHTFVSLHDDPPAAVTPDALVAASVALGERLLAHCGVPLAKLARVGAGFGGPIDGRSGEVIVAPRAAGWERYPLRARLEAAFDAPVLIENDAKLIAIAEATFGAGRGAHQLFYIHLSSGVGGGLVIDGRLYHGATTTAGEIGHAPVGLHAGTFEDHLSVGGLLRRANALGLQTDRLSDVFGDHDLARQVAAEAADVLALALAQVAALLDPQLIVVGGAVARSAGQPFLAEVRTRLQQLTSGMLPRNIPIAAAVLGPDSIAIGGIAQALESMTG